MCWRHKEHQAGCALCEEYRELLDVVEDAKRETRLTPNFVVLYYRDDRLVAAKWGQTSETEHERIFWHEKATYLRMHRYIPSLPGNWMECCESAIPA